MYVCHCVGVTDTTIAAAIADGATTIEELAARIGVGVRCHGCWPALDELLERAGGTRPPPMLQLGGT